MTINKRRLFALTIVLSIIIFIFPFQNISALTITPTRIEISGDPGQVITKEMTLINEKDTNETLYVSYSNFEAQGESGNPAFVPAKEDLGTWMSAPESLTLAPKETKDVSIKITIPKNAEPGGHFAAIFWGTVPQTSNKNSVLIGAKMGMLVLLRVNGAVNENGGVIEFGAKNNQKYYTALPVSLYYRFQNLGGDRIKPKGEIKMKDIFGITEKKISGNPVDGNILPNSIRKIETIWEGKDGPEGVNQGNFFKKAGYEWRNFAFGHYTAKLALSYGTKNETSKASFSFWVFPWHFLLTFLVCLIVLFLVLKIIIRKYNNWVILQAKKMLRDEQAKGTHEHNTN